MIDTLKPCPFCGVAARVFTNESATAFYIGCTTHDCRGGDPVAMPPIHKWAAEIARWNRRPARRKAGGGK